MSRWVRVSCACLALLTTAACGATTSSASSAKQSSQLIKIAAASTSLSYSPVYIAEHKGFFKQQGLNVKVVIVPGSTADAAALKAGNVQMEISNGVPLILGASKGIKNLISVGILGHRNAMQFVISTAKARTDGLQATWPLSRRLKLLKGLTVGTNLNTTASWDVRYAAHVVHLHPGSDFKMAGIGGLSAQVAALGAKEVDGIIYPPPTLQLAMQHGSGTLLFNGFELPGQDNMVYLAAVVTRQFGQSHPQTVRKILRALAEGTGFLRSHFNQSVTILEHNEFAKEGPKLVAGGLKVYQAGWQPSLVSTAAMWRNTVTLMEQGGIMSANRAQQLALSKLWTNRFLTNAPTH